MLFSCAGWFLREVRAVWREIILRGRDFLTERREIKMTEQKKARAVVLPEGSFWSWRHCWECPYREEYKDGWWCNKYNRSEKHDSGCNPD